MHITFQGVDNFEIEHKHDNFGVHVGGAVPPNNQILSHFMQSKYCIKNYYFELWYIYNKY